MAVTSAQAWRDYEIDGVPASGPHRPDKREIRAWGSLFETVLNGSFGGLAYSSRASLLGDLAHANRTLAIVYDDTIKSYNGQYVKSGNSGAGTWTRIGDLPNGVVRLTVTGGTANAIVASAPETPQLPGAKLYLLTPAASNTDPVTIVVNGAAPVAIETAFGSALPDGALIAGATVLMTWTTDRYALLVSSAIDGAAILADAIEARDDAEVHALDAAASASALGNQVRQYDTRALAAVPSHPAGVQALRVTRYAAGRPLAHSTYVRGGSTGPDAFQDGANAWWQLDLTGAVVPAAWFGVVGDEGVTDNSVALQKAIDAAAWRGTVELPVGAIHCVTPPTNPWGVHFRGKGYITIATVDGYRTRWDQRGDQYELVTGTEYLSAWKNAARSGAIASAKVEFLGDSTTAGAAIADPAFYIDQLVKDNMLSMGAGINPVVINRGVSGATTEDIRVNQVPLSIANSPHLIVLGPGHNDIYSRLGAPGPKTYAEIEAAAELVRASLDAALASIRASFNHLRLSVLLMSPNSASLSLDGRDERYYETLSPMFRALARKYTCCCVDKYRVWRDARDMNDPAMIGKWLDRPYGATNGGIHPLEIFNLDIADLLTHLIMPPTLARVISPSVGTQVASPGLQSGWSAASGQTVFARRDGKTVNLEGLIQPGTTSASTVLLALPAGMRPAQRAWRGCTTVLDNTNCNVARVYVETNGNVVLQFWPTGSTAMSLGDISFQID